ncbi:MAG TPA: sigma-54 dependent transcriptional regulator [Blastocatellia bacterium]|nr:sigma-54 dependent transcriptional regulator [Blastocatellia bacterium]
MNPVIGSLEKIFRDAEIAARSSEAVLILGETGVGKEVLARYIHEHSRRRDRPFFPINCAAIPAHLLESELFGYERGAFTGATQSRKGLLEQAEGGTVFLDEITEIPLEAQAKLLRTIETCELIPLGGTKYRTIDVRFIAATNSDIKPKVERGEFRRDLYYRLSIYVYTIPPLRERLQDIPPLVRHFLAEAGGSARLSPAVLELFLCYPWPGNVRELKNVISYALARANGQTIGIEHLPEHITARCHRPDVLLGTRLEEKTACFEAHLLAEMIKHYPDPREAASRLGLGLRTFYRKLKKYGLTLRRP